MTTSFAIHRLGMPIHVDGHESRPTGRTAEGSRIGMALHCLTFLGQPDADPMHGHHYCVKRTGHALGMNSPERAPALEIVGQPQRREQADVAATDIAAAFVAWLRDQVTDEGGS